MNNAVEPVAQDMVRATAEKVIEAANEAFRAESDLDPEFAKRIGGLIVDEIPGLFEQFNFGNPEVLDDMANSVAFAMSELHTPELQNMTLVTTAVAHWQGNAADKFREFFVAPFPLINSNQLSALGALHNSIMASRGIVYAGRQGAVSLGKQAIARLKQIKEEEESSDVLGTILTIVGVVASIAVAAIPVIGAAAAVTIGTGAKVTSLGLTMVGQGATLAKSELDKPSVQGETTAQVLASLKYSIGQLWNAVQEETGILRSGVDADIAALDINALLPRSPGAVPGAVDDKGGFRPPPADD